MGKFVFSPRFLLLCSLVLLACCLHDSEAWRRFRFRFRRIVPRIRVRRIVPRIRIRRILPRISWPRIRLPRIRIRIRLRRVIDKIRIPWIRRHTPRPTPPPVGTIPEECRTIVARTDWAQGVPVVSNPSIQLPILKTALYMKANNCTSRATCIAQAKTLHSSTESYNFMIGGEGTVFEGHGWDYVSNHNYYKATEYGFCFIGDVFPTDSAFNALNTLIECGLTLGKINANWTEEDLILRF